VLLQDLECEYGDIDDIPTQRQPPPKPRHMDDTAYADAASIAKPQRQSFEEEMYGTIEDSPADQEVYADVDSPPAVPPPRSQSKPEATYDTGEAYEPEATYDTGEAYEPEATYDTGEAYEPEATYDTGEAYEPEATYDTGEARDSEALYDTGEADDQGVYIHIR